MNDPERLLHGSAGGLSARLLRAGVQEAPSPRSVERTLAAVGIATAALGAASTAGAFGAGASSKAVSSLTLLGLAKWAGMGVASGVAVSLAAHGLDTQSHAVRAAPAVVATAAPRAITAREHAVPRPTATAAAAPIASTHAPAPAASARVADAPGDAPLAAEVVFVDRGRALFQRRDASGALSALAGYERAFPERRLMPEVLYLRMEAFSASGDGERARELAQRIVRDFGTSPHAARARALLSPK